MATKKINIKLIRKNSQIPVSHNGNWYDCYVSGITLIKSYETDKEIKIPKNPEVTQGIVRYEAGDTIIIYLGFAMDIGEGFEAHIIPRSSVYNNYGLILTNSMGLIDDTYKGNEDEWKGVFYATRVGSIRVDNRLLQMTIKKSNPKFTFLEVDDLGNENRAGYGSTGK